MSNKRMFLSLFWILLGAALLICGSAGLLDEYWSGMGGGLLGVGIVQTIRNFRYRSNADYRDKIDRANKDERNKFLSTKAWSWAGYFFVMIAAVSSILLKIAGRDDLMQMAAGSVCLILVLYWLCFLYLRRKY